MTPKIGTAEVRVGRELSGGVRISLGGNTFVLSPQDAIEFAKCIATHAGAVVEVGSRPRPTIIGLNGWSVAD